MDDDEKVSRQVARLIVALLIAGLSMCGVAALLWRLS